MSRFEYRDSIPAAVLSVIKEHFEPLAWMIPQWCQRVCVFWDADGHENAALTTQVEIAYRWASIGVYPCWLNQNADVQRDNAIHEMLHIHINPMFDYANNTIAVLLHDNEVSKVLIQDSLTKLMEGSVQDLTNAVFGQLGPIGGVDKEKR